MKRIFEIKVPDINAKERAREHWNSVAKPLGSLGLLEEFIEKIAAVQGTENVDLGRRAAVVFCADNGVVSEGISQSDSEVTALCGVAIADGRSNINALAREYSTDVFAYDIGICRDVDCEKLINKKINYGTKNIAEFPAMTTDEAERAICVGIDAVLDLKNSGYKIIVGGEMGIGNTTTAAALASVILDLPPRIVTGRGAGLDSKRLERKISVAEKAIALHKPHCNTPLELLARLGGFDIAALCGLYLGGAIYGIPVIIDGVIAAAAANLAVMISPNVKEFLLASHVSSEPAGKLLLQKIGLEAVIHAEMHLGEGTGAIMLLPLLDGALAVYNSSHKFDELGIERYELLK